MEASVLDAVRYLQANPHAKKSVVARDFGISRGKLYNRLKGHGGPYRPPAANLKLKPAEERAICSYIDRLDQSNLAVRAEFLGDVANRILREKAGPADPTPPPTVGQRWVSRFAKRHGYSQRVQKKSYFKGRVAPEDVEAAAKQFEELREIIAAEGVIPEDVWTMTETVTGFRGRVTSNQLIITKKIDDTPFNPILIPIPPESEERNPESPTTPVSGAANRPPSSPQAAQPPTSTLRRIHEAGNEIERALAEAEDLDPQLAQLVGRFLKSSIINATKLLRTGNNLLKARSTGRIQKQRRSAHNSNLSRETAEDASTAIEDSTISRPQESA